MSDVSFINPTTVDPPIGQYSQISIVDPSAALLHVAGQLPLDSTGELVADEFNAQAEHVFTNLATLLEAGGSAMNRILYLRTYMTRQEDYARFKAVRAHVFERHAVTDPPPATTVIVAGLVGGSLIELDAVAAVDSR